MTDHLLGRAPIGSEGETVGTTAPDGQGRLIGRRYRLLSPVGRGGMGMVWHAYDVLLDRDVAVKELLLPPGLDLEGKQAAHLRMMREARSAARLSHPGIVTVHDVVEEDGRPWIVMELLRAWSLEQAVRRNGPMSVAQTAEIGIRVLDALRHAHTAGVLHRDVKPGNVLLTSDRVVLTDFGLAALESDSALAQAGLLMGSPAYIPPERLSGGPLTPAGDLWSFGATLYAAVEGRPPYDGPDTMAVLGMILTQEPARPHRAGALITVIEGLLRRDPVERMTAAQTADLLERVLRSHGSTPPSPGPSAPAGFPGPATGEPDPELGPSGTVPPPERLSGPMPSRIVETPSGPVRVPYASPSQPPQDRPVRRDAAREPAERAAFGRSARREGSRRRRRGKGGWTHEGRPTARLLLAGGIAALGATVAALFVLSSPTPTPGTPPPASSNPAPAVSPPRRAEVPHGYRVLSEGRLSAALPKGWTVRRGRGEAVVFSGPKNSDRDIIVVKVPAEDPMTALGRADRTGLDEYIEVGVAPVRYGGWRAADWEYTYVRPGGAVPMHRLTRYVAVDDRVAYLITFTVQDLDWEASTGLLRTFFGTFTPGA